MGMIPILLALCGFVLLWSILNYNSLLSKQSEIQVLASRMEILLNERKENITGLKHFFAVNQINAPGYLDQLEYLPHNRSTSKEVIWKGIDQTQFATIQQHPEFNSLLSNLENADKEVLILQRKLRQLTSEYNQQVSKMPSRLIALLFGFKPKIVTGI